MVNAVVPLEVRTYQIVKTVEFTEMERHCPVEHKIVQNSRFQSHPGENEVSC